MRTRIHPTQCIYGISIINSFKVFDRDSQLVLDYYITDFQNKVVVDWETPSIINFYNLTGKNYLQNFILDLANISDDYLISTTLAFHKENPFVPISYNFNSYNVKKILITASGGPFYFNKKINLKKVTKKQVLSHPKWKMGSNNLIDSSNFVNKFLEILELSYIYDIPLNKIDFVALNQGSSGPNTAELRIYDDSENLLSANQWNLATGSTATLIIVKK